MDEQKQQEGIWLGSPSGGENQNGTMYINHIIIHEQPTVFTMASSVFTRHSYYTTAGKEKY